MPDPRWAKYDPEYDEASLKKYRKAALKFTNEIREKLGMNQIEDLVPGMISESNSCTVTKSLESPGLHAETGYNVVEVYRDLPNKHFYCEDDDHMDKGYSMLVEGDVGDDVFLEHGKKDHITPTERVQVPADVIRFLKAFDDMRYPDLDVQMPRFEIV